MLGPGSVGVGAALRWLTRVELGSSSSSLSSGLRRGVGRRQRRWTAAELSLLGGVVPSRRWRRIGGSAGVVSGSKGNEVDWLKNES